MVSPKTSVKVGGGAEDFPGRSCGDLEAPDTMEVGRIFFRRCVSFAFDRERVNEDRAFQIFHVPERLDEKIQAVSLDRADVPESECFKEHARREEGDEGVFALANKAQNVFSHAGNRFQEILELLPEVDETSPCHLSAQEG